MRYGVLCLLLLLGCRATPGEQTQQELAVYGCDYGRVESLVNPDRDGTWVELVGPEDRRIDAYYARRKREPLPRIGETWGVYREGRWILVDARRKELEHE